MEWWVSICSDGTTIFFFDFDAALRQTVMMFVHFYAHGLQPLTSFGRYFIFSIYVVCTLTFAYAGWMLLRPLWVHLPHTPEQRARAEAILKTYGRSPLSSFALFPDKVYYFSPGGSVVAYVVKGQAAVALGEAMGPMEDLPGAVQGFRAFCERQGWQASFYPVHPGTLDAFRAAGFVELCIGREMWVDLLAFDPAQPAHVDIELASEHLRAAGYVMKVHQPPHTDAFVAELHEVSDEWVTMMRCLEWGFSTGWFENAHVRRSSIAAVHSPEGWVAAFAVLISDERSNGAAARLTLDFLRCLREAEAGIRDFLLAEIINWAKTQGYVALNLGISAPEDCQDEHTQVDDPRLADVLRRVNEHFDQMNRFRGVRSLKKKLVLQEQPCYLLYPEHAALPEVWAAVERANHE